MEEKIVSTRLVIPWGLKVHIGVEDVFVKPTEDVLEDNDIISTYLNSTNSHSQQYEKITSNMMSLIMQSRCLLNSSYHTSIGKNVILDRLILFEKHNFDTTKLAKGKTFTIEHPWAKPTKVDSHNCLPNLIEFQLWLMWKRSYDKKDMPPVVTNVEAPGIENFHSLPNMASIRFRCNYVALH